MYNLWYIYILMYIYIYIDIHIYIYAYIIIYIYYWISRGLGVLGFFTVYWVSKSKCIISSNLRAEGSRKSVECCDFCWISGPQVQLAFQRNWNSRKQSETVGNSRERPGVIVPKLSIRHFFAKKNVPRNPFFFWKCNGKQLETVGARTFDSAKNELFKTI